MSTSAGIDEPHQLLKARGISVTLLARARGLDRAHLWNSIRGLSPCTPDELVALADCLDLPITLVLPDRMLRKALQ